VVVKNSKILEQDLPSKFNIQHGVQSYSRWILLCTGSLYFRYRYYQDGHRGFVRGMLEQGKAHDARYLVGYSCVPVHKEDTRHTYDLVFLPYKRN
jgi:hypothetical protein